MDTPVKLAGIGLFTGVHAGVSILQSRHPGIRFRNNDGRVCRAIMQNVADTKRRTTLQSDALRVQMVEHVLAGLWGLGISDAIIEVDSEELPMLDGSAGPYVDLLKAWPRAKWNWLRLTVCVEWESDTSRFVIEPSPDFAVTYHLMKQGTELCRYQYRWSPESFIDEISRARTFAWSEDWSELKHLPGFDNHSGFLLGEATPSEAFLDAGRYAAGCGPVISVERPRYPEEAARHKILDLIGDWALTEQRIACHVHAWGTGHTENMIMTQKVRQALHLDFSRVTF